MSRISWASTSGLKSYILTADTQTIEMLIFGGKSAEKAAKYAARQLAEGADPSAIEATVTGPIKRKESLRVALADVTKIAVHDNNNGVGIHYRQGLNERSFLFATHTNDEAALVARELASRLGDSVTESRQDADLFSALIVPGLSSLVCLVATSIVYLVARGADATIRGSRRGLKTVIVLLGGTLGPSGTILVGTTVLIACIGWGVYRIKFRPKQIVWARVS